MGYRFQFVTLAGFHAVCASMFDLAHGYAQEGMSAYVQLQEHEFALEESRLHGDAPPARGRRRLLRRRARGGHRRRELDARAQGLDRGGAVRGGARSREHRRGRDVGLCAPDEAGVLTPEALDLVVALQREFGGRREELLAGAGRAPGADLGRRAPRLPRVDARGSRGRLARRAGAGRSPGPARRDHRARGRPQDGDQRVQLGRADLHGRLRGRELAHVGERRRRPAEPHRRDRADDLARRRRRRATR